MGSLKNVTPFGPGVQSAIADMYILAHALLYRLGLPLCIILLLLTRSIQYAIDKSLFTPHVYFAAYIGLMRTGHVGFFK